MNIRVSESEFQSLREACRRIGTRNISELARNAMKHIIDSNRPASVNDQDLLTCLTDLESRLSSLQAEVARMKVAFTSPK